MKSIFWLVSLVATTAGAGVKRHNHVQPEPTLVVDPSPHPFITEEPSQFQDLEIVNSSQVIPDYLDNQDSDDIEWTDEQWNDLKMRKARNDERYRWPEGSDGYPLVPYVFADSLDQNAVRFGINHWMEHTCIRFKETTNTNQNHLQFVSHTKCRSYVGMIYHWTSQTIKLNPSRGCLKLSSLAHEIGHAIGFYHEQSRSDRDDYITILTENMDEGNSNFYKANTNNYNVPYDYTSVMHYHAYASSNNRRPTIVSKDVLAQSLVGKRGEGLSHRDKLTANRMYKCIEKWLSACSISSDPCLNGGYTGKDCRCVCPPGTSGSLCEKVTGDYYVHRFDDPFEHITTEKTILNPPKRGRYQMWIEPPACKKAKMTFTYSGTSAPECSEQYLYIKTSYSSEVGKFMCFKEDITTGATLESSIGIFITVYNYYTYNGIRSHLAADVTFEDIPGCSTTPTPGTDPCRDKHTKCDYWARKGECMKNPKYMLKRCKLACNVCEPDKCFNNNINCDNLAARGECQKDPSYMLTYCKKACNVCETSSCINIKWDCDYWAHLGYCEGKYQSYMYKNCKKACSVCETDHCTNSNIHCDYMAHIGECQKNPGYMLKHCKKACNACETDHCTNSNIHCGIMALTGECQKNPGYMLKHCKKACNACDVQG